MAPLPAPTLVFVKVVEQVATRGSVNKESAQLLRWSQRQCSLLENLNGTVLLCFDSCSFIDNVGSSRGSGDTTAGRN